MCTLSFGVGARYITYSIIQYIVYLKAHKDGDILIKFGKVHSIQIILIRYMTIKYLVTLAKYVS